MYHWKIGSETKAKIALPEQYSHFATVVLEKGPTAKQSRPLDGSLSIPDISSITLQGQSAN